MGSTTFSSWIQLNPSCQQVLSLALAGILHKSGPRLRFTEPELVSRRQVVAGHRRMKAVVPSLSRSAYTVDSDHDVFQGCVPLRYPAGQSSKRTSSPHRSSQPSSTTTKSMQCMGYPTLSHLVACIEPSRHQHGAFWRSVGGDHCRGLSYGAAEPTGQLASPSLAK